ncbi:hypothetical protein D3C78_481450 [compost metagenome]
MRAHSFVGRESAQHAERLAARSMPPCSMGALDACLSHTDVSGQNSGITTEATSHSRMFSGMPTFMKSLKR